MTAKTRSIFPSLGAVSQAALYALSALVAALSTVSHVGAQSPPSAGSLQQQIDRELQGGPQRLPVQPSAKPMPELAPVGQTVTVRAFRFTGNTLLSTEELGAAVSHLLNRPLDFARLQSSVASVIDAYREKGWVVRAYLPEQDIDKGEVTIAIVEAVFGQALIGGQPSKRLQSQTVLDIFARQQKTGEFLNMDALERALLLADDLPGVSVMGTLTPGQKAGQTDLLVQLADEPLVSSTVSGDNGGSVSTGSLRTHAAIGLNSPSGHGDGASLNLMSARGTRYGRMGYSIPLGADGWRVGVNASRLDYELISDAYRSLHASGSSSTAGLELSYPLVRSRARNLSVSVSADRKEFFNVSGGATSSAYRSAPLSIGLSASSFDTWGAGGANALSVVLSQGRLDLTGSPTEASDAATTRSAGSYSKVRYALSRQQQVSTTVSLYAALSGQWAGKNLDSSEKFYLGGSNGVRAYPSNEGGGSVGQLLSVELRWQLPDGVNVIGFYDHGRVVQNVRNDFAGASAINAYALKGAGLALGWRGASGLSIQTSYARRIGKNPNPITTDINRGADQDGTLHRDRVWLNASWSF